ncbi:TIGR04222 domain-containing membrane protein [Streptomyces californicus]|uniref:TIGR04222 domain-containing membrane protein n=1 Tax=Streptomyces californicus TaxID=67351 RepID=UPI00296FEAD0|nr:TIGR04222 domain-containing membrane protein [Streptomyces californicus]MDW4899862.1 TIGR04222 domain-containing membrane protein [Streptomyces californicus]
MNALAVVLNLAALVSAVLLVTTAVSAGSRRPSAGPFPGVHDLYEAAFLNGGPARVVDTALTALYADGRVLIGGPGIISVQRPQADDPVERAVLQELSAAPSGALHVVREAAMRHPAVQEIGDGLAERGLLVPPAANRGLRRWGLVQGVSCLVAFPVSIVLTVFQYVASTYPYEDLPDPFVVKMLPAIVVGGISGLVVASVAARRITGAGRRAAQGFGEAHAQAADPAHLVAVRGLRALPDPALRAQLIAAARLGAPRRRRSSGHTYGSSTTGATAVATTVWCAASGPGASSCGGSSSGGGSGSGCGGGSGCSSGSGCGGGSGSSCGGGGSSCGGGGGGSSCGGGGGGGCGGGGGS